MLATENGLSIGLGDSEVTSLSVNGTEILSDAFSGFLVRDVAEKNHNGIYSFVPEGYSVPTAFRAAQPTLGLNLSADYKENGNHIAVTGTIKDATDSTEGRSVQLSYSLPVSASGWKWSTELNVEQEVSCGKASNVYKSFGENY
ncbi:MAG: hypothetical protein J5733_12015, partial [Bacteroidaceae bacterium]|nr:hypothetical protein [Bacteroidaceae bacterium]